MAARSDDRRTMPQSYADAGPRRVQRYFPFARRYAKVGEESRGLSLRTYRWTEMHHGADDRPGERLQLRGSLGRSREAFFHADVSAHAGWTHDAGRLLQSPGEQY